MNVWVPGVLSLLGALLGVGLANYLGSRAKRQEERQRRLEEAVRAVSLLRAAAQFSTRAGVEGQPDTVSGEDLDDLQRRFWLTGIERYFNRLRDARDAVAALVIDGIDLTEYIQSDSEMQARLDDIWKLLRDRQQGERPREV